MTWPISFDDVLAARHRLRPYLPPTPLRRYPVLDEAIGHDIAVYVKHENHNPTNAFKARNGLSVLTALSDEQKRRGVVAATRGNHGLGVCWAGSLLGVPATICVPAGNNPEKNAAMRALGAEVIEEGKDYDESTVVAEELVAKRGLTMVHSTNEPLVLAGAATITLEILEEQPDLDALVVAVGGGSQAVGALTVARRERPGLPIFAVQAARAAAAHDSWHKKQRVEVPSADTFADGVATRMTYDLTFPALLEGLAGFVACTEAEIAAAVRLMIETTHNLCEGAGALGLAGLCKLAPTLAGKKVGIILSGSNIDQPTLRSVLNDAIR